MNLSAEPCVRGPEFSTFNPDKSWSPVEERQGQSPLVEVLPVVDRPTDVGTRPRSSPIPGVTVADAHANVGFATRTGHGDRQQASHQKTTVDLLSRSHRKTPYMGNFCSATTPPVGSATTTSVPFRRSVEGSRSTRPPSEVTFVASAAGSSTRTYGSQFGL